MAAQSSLSSSKIPPQHTWITIFIPALLYYIFLSNKSVSNSSTTSSGILSQLGLFPTHFTTVSSQLTITGSTGSSRTTISKSGPRLLDSIFNKNSKFEYIIQNNNHNIINNNNSCSYSYSTKSNLVDTTWVEDIELGRGYLLISDIQNHGKIWRYEIGGGPIPIGKSLFMDYSGCRSNIWNPCPHVNHVSHTTYSEYEYGSSGMTVQISKDSETFFNGQLIIVEKGEQRIIRLEKDGSRTPLVLNVTSLCSSSNTTTTSSSSSSTTTSHRIQNPNLVYYTPFGDLLFTDYNIIKDHDSPQQQQQQQQQQHNIAGLYRLKEVVNIPSLHSFQQSKDAHNWTESDLQKYWMDHHSNVGVGVGSTASELLLSSHFEYISGVAVGKDLTSLYVAGRITNSDGDDIDDVGKIRFVIVKVTMEDEDEEDFDMNPSAGGDEDDDNDDDDEEDEYKNHADDERTDKPDNEENVTAKRNEQKEIITIRTKGLLDDKAIVFYDMTNLFKQSNTCFSNFIHENVGISLVIDENGLIYATFPNGVAILNEADANLLGTLTLQDDAIDNLDGELYGDGNEVCGSGLDSIVIPNSINIGKDQYFYITTKKGLMRMKTKTRPLEQPTNLIVPFRKRSQIK